MHQLPDTELIESVAELDGLPPELLANSELVELLTPRLRADLEACETYKPRDYAPLNLPLTAYGGAADPDVGIEHLAAWRIHTRGLFRQIMLPGNHFFIHRSESVLVRDVAAQLRAPALLSLKNGQVS
jgi:medium-chain acyl-[acyl-carrier-protein] hydrolase